MTRSLGEETSPQQQQQPFEAPEQEAYLNLLRTANWLEAEFNRLFKRQGLSHATYNILRILRGHRGQPLSCSAIGEQMVTQVPDVTRLIDRLEQRGLVSRERTPTDRRVVMVQISEAGLGLLAELDEPVAALHRQQLGHLTRRELDQLSAMLVKARYAGSFAESAATA